MLLGPFMFHQPEARLPYTRTRMLDLLCFVYSWQAGRWHGQLVEEAHRACRHLPDRSHWCRVSDRWQRGGSHRLFQGATPISRRLKTCIMFEVLIFLMKFLLKSYLRFCRMPTQTMPKPMKKQLRPWMTFPSPLPPATLFTLNLRYPRTALSSSRRLVQVFFF